MEQDTRKCPFCGKEILAVAVKCKYCGKWMNEIEKVTALEPKTKKCPYCGEEILTEAKKCKHCGEWLDNRATPQTPITVINNVATPDLVGLDEQGLDESDGEITWILYIEGLIITGVLAYTYDWSFWISYLAFAGICVFMGMSQIVRVVVSVGFSVLWGMLASAIFPWSYVGILAFLLSIVIHWNSMMKKIF